MIAIRRLHHHHLVQIIAALLVVTVSACASDASTDSSATTPESSIDATTTVPATVTATDASTDEPVASGGYGPATVQLEMVNNRTLPVVLPLADGVYYAQDTASDGTTVTFSLGQWFACDGDGVPDAPTVECVSGFGTLDEPSALVDMSPDAVVTVTTGDLSDMNRSDVSPAEFARLVSGAAPAADAPVGYEYRQFATFVDVAAGSVVAVSQFYTS